MIDSTRKEAVIADAAKRSSSPPRPLSGGVDRVHGDGGLEPSSADGIKPSPSQARKIRSTPDLLRFHAGHPSHQLLTSSSSEAIHHR
uniref:Uncharacterized protein n=1 Tax=Oryza sativa subsp. japonica TaxID=39947 RepID=Q6K639_ORYSJ|nr:hypothetical protein [Oryza sativa Japonica Group]